MLDIKKNRVFTLVKKVVPEKIKEGLNQVSGKQTKADHLEIVQ